MNDGRTDNQNKIQEIPPFSEEVPPVRKVRRKSYKDFDIEGDGDYELSDVKKFSVGWTRIYGTGGLYCQGSECKDDPKPLGHLVVVFEFISPSSYQATIDDTKILVGVSVDIEY